MPQNFQLTPVDYDPFSEEQSTPEQASPSYNLTPVDYDPFTAEFDDQGNETQASQISRYKAEGGGYGTALKRGMLRLKQGMAGAGAALGNLLVDNEGWFDESPVGQWLQRQTQQDQQEVADLQGQIQALPVHPTMIRAGQAASAAPDFMEGAKGFVREIYDSPDTLNVLGEQMVELAPQFATMAVGTKGADKLLPTAMEGMPRAMAALGIGGGVSSAANTYGPNLGEGLDQGLSFEEAQSRAINQSAAQGFVDAATSAVLPVKIGNRWVNVPAQTAIQMAGGGIGEIARSASVGEEAQTGDIVPEVLLEALGMPADFATEAMTRHPVIEKGKPFDLLNETQQPQQHQQPEPQPQPVPEGYPGFASEEELFRNIHRDRVNQDYGQALEQRDAQEQVAREQAFQQAQEDRNNDVLSLADYNIQTDVTAEQEPNAMQLAMQRAQRRPVKAGIVATPTKPELPSKNPKIEEGGFVVPKHGRPFQTERNANNFAKLNKRTLSDYEPFEMNPGEWVLRKSDPIKKVWMKTKLAAKSGEPQTPIEAQGFRVNNERSLKKARRDDQYNFVQNELKPTKLPKGFDDARLKRLEFRYGLEKLAKDLVEGGGIQLIPDVEYKGGLSDRRNDDGTVELPMRRTKSLNDSWFQSMAANPSTSMSVAEVKKTVAKALEGKRKLGIKESRVIKAMLGVVSDGRIDPNRVDEAKKKLQMERWRILARIGKVPSLEQAAQDIRRFGGEMQDEDFYAPDMDATARSLSDLIQKAGELGATDDEIEEAGSAQNDRDSATRLWKLIEGLNREQRQRPGAGGNAVPESVPALQRAAGEGYQADVEEPNPVGRGTSPEENKGRLGQAEQTIRAEGSGLTNDLFGKNDTAQALHDRNLARTAKERNAPSMEEGAGDLFTQKSKQVDIEDVTSKPATIDVSAHQAATSDKNSLQEPTEAQKEAGNYKKGHVKISGLDISIENPEGSKRRPEWPEMKSHYGYIKGTIGKDKDHIDVFVKPGTNEDHSGPVFVVDQTNKEGKFDEHKVLLGWKDEKSARAGYLENYTKDWNGLGAIKEFTTPEFKMWLKAGNTKKPVSLGKSGSELQKTSQPVTEKTEGGVSDDSLKKIVDEFNSAQKEQVEDGDNVTHVFDAPSKDDIVRLQDKVKVYNSKHGWMTPAEAKAKIEEWKQHAEKQGETGDNSEKVVLSLFDLTGKWSEPWEAAGYQVYRFDIQDNWEIDHKGETINVGDVKNFSTDFFNELYGSFDGNDIHAILAACPCTDFAVSGARHFAAKDNDGRTIESVKLVHHTLATIGHFKPAVWAIENPVGRIESLGGLPPWRLSFDPNHIGDPYTKKTLLWGRFNADLPIAPVEPTEGSKMHTKYGGKSLATKNARSATPEGFAYAFFMANNAIDNPAMTIANKYDRLDRGLIEKAVKSGVTEEQIDDAVQDYYYQDLDDEAANEAIRGLIKEEKPTPENTLQNVVEHTTRKGKVIQGVIRSDLNKEQAHEIDPYTFRKDGGWFIRTKHLEGGEQAKPVAKSESAPAPKPAEDRAAKKRKEVATKMRALGEKTSAEASEHYNRERNTNTARRARMAAGAEADAAYKKYIGDTMIKIADALEAGKLKALAGISNRAQVEMIDKAMTQAIYARDRKEIDSYSKRESRKGRAFETEDAAYADWPSASWLAGAQSALVAKIKGKRGSVSLASDIYSTSHFTRSIYEKLKNFLTEDEIKREAGWWAVEAMSKQKRMESAGINNVSDLKAAMLEFKDLRAGKLKEDPVKAAERALIGQNVGIDFFPTPKTLASRMVEMAGISSGMKVLEPSAGNGNIAEAIREAGADVDVAEISSALRDLLTAKKFNVVSHDFMDITEGQYDAIVMNPPFSKNQDIQHVQRAFKLLKPGGKLVAIVGEGAFFRNDKTATEFRDWLDELGATVEKLPEGTFKEKELLNTTGANARLVEIEKSDDAKYSKGEKSAGMTRADAVTRLSDLVGSSSAQALLDSGRIVLAEDGQMPEGGKVSSAVVPVESVRIGKERGALNDVHSLDITPQMRESVMQGQPLFSRKEKVQGVNKDGKIYLNLSALDENSFDGVALHEGLHETLKSTVGEKDFNRLMKRMDTLRKASESGSGDVGKFFKKAMESVPDDTPARLVNEEIAAYAVEQYTNAPRSLPEAIMKWVKDLIAAIRVGVMRALPKDSAMRGKILDSVSAADLSRLAVVGLKRAARSETTSASTEAKYSRKKNDDIPREQKSLGELTEAQRTALKNTGGIVERKSFKKWINEAKQDLGKKIAQGVVDQFAPLKELDQKAYIKARLAKGSDGALEALLMFGNLELVDGVTDAKADGVGLIESLQKLQGEQERFMWWIAANRAEGLKMEGRENLFTDDDISALKSLNQGKMPDGTDRTTIYGDVFGEFKRISKNVLDIAEQSDLIDGESRGIWERDFYVPFYRLMEEEISGPTVKSGLVKQYAFKQLKGGTKKLNADLLANVLMNWSHLLSASAKNRAAKAALETASKVGAASEVEAGTKDAVFYLEQGQKKYFAVADPYLLDAVTALEWTGFGGHSMRALANFKRYLTIGVTANPAFKIRNLLRDTLSAMAQTELSYNPVKNVTQGVKALKGKKSQTFASMLASGGLIRFGSMIENQRASHVHKLINAGVKANTILDTKEKIADAMQKAWDFYNELGDISENANRAALYEQMIAKGMSKAEAAYAARDLLDFSMGGTWGAVRFLTQVVPFMNARLQGLYKLGRAAKADRVRLAAVTGAVALASVVLMLGYGDDDDWKKREDWDRDNYWWFKIGNTAYRIPKPFEIGAIGTLAERSLELAINDEMTGKRFAERLKRMLADTFALNPVPQMFKPLIDVYANKDSFTGRDIETMGMDRLMKSDRASANTSDVARFLGLAGNQTNLSPVQIDFLIRSYFGWLGTAATTMLGYSLNPVLDRPAKPSMKLRDAFLAGNFVESLPSNQSRYLTQFYEQAKEIEEAYASYMRMRREGDNEGAAKLKESNYDRIRSYRTVSKAKAVLTRLNERQRLIESSRSMSPAEKRAKLDEIAAQKDRIARASTTGIQ